MAGPVDAFKGQVPEHLGRPLPLRGAIQIGLNHGIDRLLHVNRVRPLPELLYMLTSPEVMDYTERQLPNVRKVAAQDLEFNERAESAILRGLPISSVLTPQELAQRWDLSVSNIGLFRDILAATATRHQVKITDSNGSATEDIPRLDKLPGVGELHPLGRKITEYLHMPQSVQDKKFTVTLIQRGEQNDPNSREFHFIMTSVAYGFRMIVSFPAASLGARPFVTYETYDEKQQQPRQEIYQFVGDDFVHAMAGYWNTREGEGLVIGVNKAELQHAEDIRTDLGPDVSTQLLSRFGLRRIPRAATHEDNLAFIDPESIPVFFDTHSFSPHVVTRYDHFTFGPQPQPAPLTQG